MEGHNRHLCFVESCVLEAVRSVARVVTSCAMSSIRVRLGCSLLQKKSILVCGLQNEQIILAQRERPGQPLK